MQLFFLFCMLVFEASGVRVKDGSPFLMIAWCLIILPLNLNTRFSQVCTKATWQHLTGELFHSTLSAQLLLFFLSHLCGVCASFLTSFSFSLTSVSISVDVFYFPLRLPPDASPLLPRWRSPDGECQGKTGLRMYTHTHALACIYAVREETGSTTFCLLTSYSEASWMRTLPTTHAHTHTYTQQYSIIKPVSQPRRKQSLLYATGMSLILAEVNKCTCIEGIFHRQTADNGGIVVSICSSQYCIQSGPFSLALDPQLMSGVMFHLSD